MENHIINFILGMNLSLPLAILVAFRAGHFRGLSEQNMEERLGDLAFDSLKEQICEKMEALFIHWNGANLPLPGRLTIQQVAAHIHNDVEDMGVLQQIYFYLVNQGMDSEYFLQALEYVNYFGGFG